MSIQGHLLDTISPQRLTNYISGGWFNIRMQSYQYSYSHCVDKTHGLVQDCSNSIAYALELLQSCTKPSRWTYDSPISTMGIPILVRLLYIQSGHWPLWDSYGESKANIDHEILWVHCSYLGSLFLDWFIRFAGFGGSGAPETKYRTFTQNSHISVSINEGAQSYNCIFYDFWTLKWLG